MFQVVIENQTTHVDVDALWLAKVAKAITRQLARDVCPSYGKALWNVAASNDKAAPGPRVVLFDDGDQAGVLGYHDVGPDGTPYAKVFTAGLTLDQISETLSHEILELVVDPDAGGYRYARGSARGYADEACDAVQGTPYRIDDVFVANFVLPAWYVAGSPGPWDFMQRLPGPATKTPAGYLIVREANGTVDTDPPEAKALPAKAHPASRTARRLARAALVAAVTALVLLGCGGLPILQDPDPAGCHGVTCAGVCCPATFVCASNGRCEAGDAPPIGWGEGARRARDAGADAR